MSSLLGDTSNGFVYGDNFLYDCTPELAANISGHLLIETDGLIRVSEVVMSLGGTVNSAIKKIVSTGRGLPYWISWILRSY